MGISSLLLPIPPSSRKPSSLPKVGRQKARPLRLPTRRRIDRQLAKAERSNPASKRTLDTDMETDTPERSLAAMPGSPCPVQDAFVKTILHRCVDLGWRDARLAAEAGVSKGLWSQIRTCQKGLTLKTAAKIAGAVGLEIGYTQKANVPALAQRGGERTTTKEKSNE